MRGEAMELHQIEEKLRWYEAREAILKRISPELNSVIDLDKFLIATVQELGRMMGVDKCDFIVPNGDQRLREILTRNGTRSFLCIPVVFQDELLGILGFHHCKEVHKWSEDEINFLKSLTQQTSIALQYTRLYTRMEKEVEITKTLLEITNEINSKVDFSEITSFVLRKAVELLDATYGSIGILDTAERKLSITTFYPEGTPSLRNIGLNVSLNAPYYDAILDKKTVSIFGEEG